MSGTASTDDEPDLEPLAPRPVDLSDETDPPDRRPRSRAALVALVIVALVTGFGAATLVLNARDDGHRAADGSNAGGPSGSSSRVPNTARDPDEQALGDLILQQREVPSGDTVVLRRSGASLGVATLDLCNGSFASEARRTARRQVDLADGTGQTLLSTEAVLYRRPADGAFAFSELKSVAAHCPATPVVSPVGEPTVATTFGPAPDGAWPHTDGVERLAYDFVSTDPATHEKAHSVAVYLRRGRALIGIYFALPDGVQPAIAGRTTIPSIVALFESRMAELPASVVTG